MKSTVLGACALAICAGAANAGTLSNIFTGYFALGDSLGDTGNIAAASGGAVPPAPYVGGYFSNGQPFTGYIADEFDPSQVRNYAHGSAEAVNPGPEPFPASLALHLDEQLALFQADAAGGSAAGSLVTVLFGANDIFEGLEIVATPSVSPPDPLSYIAGIAQEAAAAVAGATAAIAAYGPAEIVVLNLPDIGGTPAYAGTALEALATGATEVFNQTLAALLPPSVKDTEVTLFDLKGLFDEAAANPTAFGLDPALTGIPCFGVPAAIPDCEGFLFADLVHPTTHAHAIIAAEITGDIAPVPLPAGLPLLAGGLVLLGLIRRRAA